MNKPTFVMSYESPMAQIIEVQVEYGFGLSGGSTGESGLPDEDM